MIDAVDRRRRRVRSGERAPRRRPGRAGRDAAPAPRPSRPRRARSLARSPLAGAALPPGVAEVPFLRPARPPRRPRGRRRSSARLAERIGAPLPIAANTFTTSADGARRVVWLGTRRMARHRRRRHRRRPRGGPAVDRSARRGAVVDVSANRTALSIAGPGARELLEHGCAIDLHPRVFGPGRAAQTNLARANVIVLALDDGAGVLGPRPSLVRRLPGHVAARCGRGGRAVGLTPIGRNGTIRRYIGSLGEPSARGAASGSPRAVLDGDSTTTTAVDRRLLRRSAAASCPAQPLPDRRAARLRSTSSGGTVTGIDSRWNDRVLPCPSRLRLPLTPPSSTSSMTRFRAASRGSS